MTKKTQPYNPGQNGQRDHNQYEQAANVKDSRISRRMKRTWKQRRGTR